SVLGQVPVPAGVEGVREAYEKLDFDLALARADSIIRIGERQDPSDLVQVHTIAALVHIARNRPSAAKPHFLSALSIDPDLELNPTIASPQALELFRSAQAEMRSADSRASPSAITYLRVYDPRPAAAYRSMLVPGWGQIYKGQRKRGYLFMGLWGATAAGTIAAHIVRHDREQAYLDETDPTQVPSRFDDFNRWHKVRNNLAIGAALTWVVSYLDALIFEGPDRPAAGPSLNLSYRPAHGVAAPSINLKISLP
ncbi:MAG: hypothetical protein R3178_06390, partial [Rhodothermales bacterium]|nr:hypothetical protein [Rhodothermales bacterium]